MLAHDIGRGLDSVDLVSSQHAQVVDEVPGALGKHHQLLGRLHRLSRGEVAEQLAQDVRYVDLPEQFSGLGLGHHIGRAGHGGSGKLLVN
ncbi:hypothetical protein D3C84_926200 [compost metagenome]